VDSKGTKVPLSQRTALNGFILFRREKANISTATAAWKLLSEDEKEVRFFYLNNLNIKNFYYLITVLNSIHIFCRFITAKLMKESSKELGLG
jgi:hypothetical protein